MKTQLKSVAAGAAGAGLALVLIGCNANRSSEVNDYETTLRADASGRSKDPAWQASHKETALIRVSERKTSGLLHNFCINPDGNILACWGGTSSSVRRGASAAEPTCIKVLSPEGMLLATWPLDFQPQAVCVNPTGQVIVGGKGRLAKLDAEGKVLLTGSSPALAQPVMTDEEILAMLKEWKRPASELAQYREAMQNRRNDITSLAANGQEVFVACAAPKGYAYAVYRVDADFKNPKLLVDKLSGCCAQMDIAEREGKVWVAHNGRHRVECFDQDGKKLSSFGKTDRRAADGFGGCCEPKNIRITKRGDILAAESGPPVAIKRFTPEGKFLGVVAVPTFETGCVRVTVDVSLDGDTFYLLDTGGDVIHTFAANKSGT